MLKILSLAFILLQAIFPNHTMAGATGNTLILTLGLDNGAQDVLFITVDKAKDSQPACHTNGNWAYVLPLSSDQNKKIYAMLLAARASQMPVTLTGNNACSVFSGIETLQAAYY